MPKFQNGEMMIGIGAKKPQIGDGIGHQKIKNTCTQNMRL